MLPQPTLIIICRMSLPFKQDGKCAGTDETTSLQYWLFPIITGPSLLSLCPFLNQPK